MLRDYARCLFVLCQWWLRLCVLLAFALVVLWRCCS